MQKIWYTVQARRSTALNLSYLATLKSVPKPAIHFLHQSWTGIFVIATVELETEELVVDGGATKASV
jgi:hypothetical protein